MVSMLLVKTAVKNSNIEGLGLFAAEDIPANTQIWAYHEDYHCTSAVAGMTTPMLRWTW